MKMNIFQCKRLVTFDPLDQIIHIFHIRSQRTNSAIYLFNYRAAVHPQAPIELVNRKDRHDM